MQRPEDSLNHLLRSGLLGQLEDVCSQALRATVGELEALAPDLRQLETQIHCSRDRPNLFDMLVDDKFINHHEERLHSKILNRLLDPNSDEHSLGDSFLRSMLGEVAGRFRVDGGTCSDPTLQNLSDTKVTLDTPIDPEKSRRRPDFYLVNERLRFAVIVENKIGHIESRDQLKDYWEAMREDKPGFKIAGIFLAPERRKPEQAGGYPYVSLSYGDIADLLMKGLKDTATNSERDGLPKQYADAIRRWFVLEPEQKKLAWQILQQYPKAIELLQNKESQPVQQLVDELSELICGQSGLECLSPDPTVKDLEWGNLGFILKEWDEINSLRTGAYEEKETVYKKRLIAFWFSEPERDLAIYIAVATPTHAKDKTVQKAIARAVSGSGFRQHDFGEPNPNWIDFLVRQLASKEELKNPDRDVVFEQIRKAWKLFVKKDLPKLSESIQGMSAFRQSSRRSSRAA